MFGLLTDDAGWSRRRLGRFAGRRFGDTDWGPLIAAGVGLTTTVINAVAHSQGGAAPQCPQGYVYAADGLCHQTGVAQQQGGFDLSNISPTTLAIGGVVLVLLLTEKKD